MRVSYPDGGLDWEGLNVGSTGRENIHPADAIDVDPGAPRAVDWIRDATVGLAIVPITLFIAESQKSIVSADGANRRYHFIV